ncbi:hypothetical protein PENTCL1PPCAC_7309, partial [Pristionchus entomophagus]
RLILLRNLANAQKKTAKITRQSESSKEDLATLQLQSKVLEKGMKKLRKENGALLNAKPEVKGKSTDACENEDLMKYKLKMVRDLEETRKKFEKMEKLVNEARTKMTSMKSEMMKMKEEKGLVNEKLNNIRTSLNRANGRIEELTSEMAEMEKNATQRSDH